MNKKTNMIFKTHKKRFNFKLAVSILLACLFVFAVGVFLCPKALLSVLPIGGLREDNMLCTIYDLSNSRTIETSPLSLEANNSFLMENVKVVGPFFEKNVVVNGREIDVYLSERQNKEDEYKKLPSIRLIEENGKYYINYENKCYMVVSGEADIKEWIACVII